MSLTTITRPQEVNLSISSFSKQASQRMGLFFLGVALLAVAGYVFSYMGGRSFENPPPKPLLYLFGLLFGTGGYGFLTYAYFFSTRPRQPLVHTPGTMALKALQPISKISLIFAAVAFVLYNAELVDKKMQEVLLILQFMGGVFALVFLWKIFEAIRSAIQAMRFGKSYFKPTSKQLLSRGTSFTGIFENARLSNQENRVQVCFRNLQESWPNTQMPVTTILSEAIQEVQLKGSQTPIELHLPADGKPTDYHKTNPCYWELEVKGVNTNFYSRFFVEVS